MELTIRKSELEDWYVIERLEHDGREWFESAGPNSMALRCSSRFSDADVEGPGEEMLAIAAAIENRGYASFRRCAVDARAPLVRFNSPRNSTQDGVASLVEADKLAARIRELLSTGGGR